MVLIEKKARFYVYVSNTEEAVNETVRLIERMKLGEELVCAEIRYGAGTLPWTSDPKDECNYPLHFIFNEEEIWVSAISAGYNGTGPHGTLELLKNLGVENSEVEAYILGKRGKEVFLKIFQDGSIELL